MLPNDAQSSESSLDSPNPVLTWRVHLIKRQPKRLPVLLFSILFGALCTAMIFHQLLPVVVVVLLLVSSVSEYLFPITYTLNAEGASCRWGISRTAMSWKTVKRLRLHPKGVLLSPLEQPSKLDNFRGILLYFARASEHGDKAEVLDTLQHYLPDHCKPLLRAEVS